MDESKELKISIVAGADLKGFSDTTDATKKLGASQYDLGADLGKAEKRIEGVSGQSREMYRIFYALDRLMPGMGETIRGLVTGPLGLIGAALYVFYDAEQWVKKLNDALDKLGDEAATSGNKMSLALEEARKKGQQMAEEMSANLANLTNQQESLTDAVQRFVAGLQTESGFTDNAINAAADYKISQARQLLALGLLSQEQATLLENQAREDAAQAIANQKKQEIEDERVANERGWNRAEAQQSGLKSAMDTAYQNAFGSTDAIDRQARIKVMEDQLNKAAGRTDETANRLNTAQAAFESLGKVQQQETAIQAIRGFLANPNLSSADKTREEALLNQAKAQLESLKGTTQQGLELSAAEQQAAEDAYALSGAFKKHLADLENQQHQAENSYQQAQKNYDENAESLKKFKSAIEAATDKLAALNSPEAAGAAAADHAKDTKATLAAIAGEKGTGAEVERTAIIAKSIADAIESGHGVTGDQQNFLMGFMQSIGVRVNSVKQAADFLQKNIGNDDQLLSLVEHIINSLASRDAGAAAMAAKLAELNSRYITTARQIGNLSTSQ